MRRFSFLLILALALAACSSATPAPTPQPTPAPTPTPAGPTFSASDERWAGRSIYFVMTDRFANGDPSNDNADGFASDPTDPRAWHGGDFQGLIDRLDYIQGMGFDALWITPVTKQRSPNAYHGYWQYDLYAIDPHFGSLADLKRLVDAAHARDMLVMLDVVPNHTGDFLPGSTAAPPFDQRDWYHNQGNIENYGDQQEVEDGDLLGLDDFDQDNPAARAELLRWITWLRDETGIDGLRIDTAKHLPKDFLAEFDAAADLHSMGEVFNGDVAYVAPYSTYVDAVTDFPLYYGMKNALLTSQPLQNITNVLANDAAYRNPHVNGIFLDNHDLDRAMCLLPGLTPEQKEPLLHQALAVLFTLRGIPIIYYGTEQGFAGCSDPFNRENFFTAADPSSPTYAWLAELNALRKQHPALMRGSLETRFVDADGWVFERTYGDDTVIVCVNQSRQPRSLSAELAAQLPPETPLVDGLGSATATLAGSAFSCDVGPKQVAVFAPQR